MATRRLTITTDDLTGEELDTSDSVRFGIDGRDYEIDLSEENAGKLREALAPFIDAARLTKWPRGRRRS